jgi:hypothetical protein
MPRINLKPSALTARFVVFAALGSGLATGSPAQTGGAAAHPTETLIGGYCMDCHDDGIRKGKFSLEGLDAKNPAANAALWEKVLRKLDHRQMPPVAEERPDAANYDRVVAELQRSLDLAAAAAPNPGRTDESHRVSERGP